MDVSRQEVGHKRHCKRRMSVKMSIFVLAMAMTVPVVARAQEVLTLESSRPLQEAISILERKYGWRISYEDPPYTDLKDLADKTHPTYPGPRRAIDPRGGRVEVRYSVSPLTGEPDSQGALLQMLVDDHASRGNPGRFQVKVIQDVHFVIPIQGSVLDTPISLPEKQRTFDEALEETVQAVTRVTGIRVRVTRGMHQPSFEHSNFGANAEAARNVLLRLFETQSRDKFCWHTLYAPNWGYSLNIDTRQAPVAAATPQPPKRRVMTEVNADGSKVIPPAKAP